MKLSRRLVHGLAVGLFALVACNQPMTLPGAPIGPTITKMTPGHGFAGDTLVLEGVNFDPTPANNEVLFPWNSARAAGFDREGRLLVTVPEAVNNSYVGPVVVVTPFGRSEAKDEFSYSYYGLGHPNAGVSVGDVKVLHKPEGLVATNGDVFLASAYFRLLLAAKNHNFAVQLPAKPHGVAASDDGKTLFVAFADEGVWAVDATSGEVKAQTKLDGVFIRQIVAVKHGADVAVHAIGNDRNSGAVLVTLRGALLAPDPVRRLPLRSLGAEAVSTDGKTVWISGSRDATAHLEHGILGINTGDGSATPAWNIIPANAAPVGPIAVTPWEGRDLVSVAVEDNSLAVFDTGPRTWAESNVFTGSGTRISDMVAIRARDPEGSGQLVPAVVVAKPDDQDIVAVSPVTHTVVWTAWLATAPRALAYDPVAGRVEAADDLTNVVDEVIAEDGTYTQRYTYDAGLGAVEGSRYGPVADFDPDDNAGAHHMMVLARKMNCVVPLNDYTLELDLSPFALDRSASPPVGLVSSLDGTVFVVHETDIGRFGNYKEKPRKTTEQLIIKGLESETSRVMPVDATHLLVGTQRHVDLWTADASGAWTRSGTGVGRDKGHVEEIAIRPDGKVFVLWNDVDANEPHLSGGLWTVDGLAQNALPVATYEQGTDVHGYFGFALLESGPTMFFNWCDQQTKQTGRPGRCALMLDDALKPSEPRFSMIKEVGPIGATPDRRYVLWARFALKDQVLRMGQLTTDNDDVPLLTDWTSWRTPNDFSWAGADPSGEWVYVPIPSRDTISVFK